jgi:hypothetical protein
MLRALTVRRFILPLYFMMMPAAGKYAKNAKGFMKLRAPLPLTPIESTAI